MSLSYLQERLEVSEEEARELLMLFFASAGGDLERLRSALEKGDLPGAAFAAHSIKGAAGNLGEEEMHRIAQDLEQALRKGQKEGAPGALASLEQGLEVLRRSVGVSG